MRYNCTHMATLGDTVKGFEWELFQTANVPVFVCNDEQAH